MGGLKGNVIQQNLYVVRTSRRYREKFNSVQRRTEQNV